MAKSNVPIWPFLVAIIAAPLLFSALTIWIKFLPLVVFPIAFPGHLLVGGPIYYWMLKTGRNDGVSISLASCVVAGLSLIILLAIFPAFAFGMLGYATIATLLLMPIFVFWALIFITLYRAMTGSRFAQKTTKRLIIAAAISLVATGLFLLTR